MTQPGSAAPDELAALRERFNATGLGGEAPVRRAVAAYLEWLAANHPGGPTPLAADDVGLRNYLLHLRTQGIERPEWERTLAVLRRFYDWTVAAGLVQASPFERYNFDRPFLSRDRIRRRAQALGAGPHEREVAHLRALTRLAEQLYRAPDVHTTLEVTLATLAEVIQLKAAWAFVHTEAGLLRQALGALHDFVPAACHGLPPGLEQRERYFLRKPPDCHCQHMLRSGRLRRAVNIVECTRLQNAASAAGDNQGLLFHASVPLVVHGQAVGLLNFATEEWQFLTAADLQLLSAAGAHVSLALERAQLYDLAQAQRTRLEAEMAMAREVQASLLPAALPPIPGFTLAAYWRAAREMAGDFYDVLPLPGGRWGLVIADVADKGAPAALYMAMMHSLVAERAPLAASPAALLADLNRALLRQSTTGVFVTLFYGVLDPATRQLAYANAGHNPPLLAAGDGRVEPLPRGGAALGVLDNASYAGRTITLGPAAALVAYTDGLPEALGPQQEEYGLKRLMASVARGPGAAEALLLHVTTDLAAFTGDTPLADDLTLIVLACAGRTD